MQTLKSISLLLVLLSSMLVYADDGRISNEMNYNGTSNYDYDIRDTGNTDVNDDRSCSHSSRPRPCRPRCKKVILISESDINRASAKSPNGLELDQSNTLYRICSDVHWNNTVPNSFAITIVAQDVTLDFDRRIFSQANTAQLPVNARNAAIQVAGTAANVIIQNGTIFATSGAAIVVQPPAVGITIRDMEINNTGYNGPFPIDRNRGRLFWGLGIFFNGNNPNNPPTPPPSSTTINDVVIKNVIFNGIGGLGRNADGTPTQFIPNFDPETGVFSGDVAPIWGNQTNNVTVEDVIINDSWGDHNVYNITFEPGSRGLIKNCVVNGTRSHALNKGILLGDCSGWTLEDNTIDGATCTYVRDSVANPNISFEGNPGSEGIKIVRSNNCIVRRLNVTNMIGVTDTSISPTGFNIDNAEVVGIADHNNTDTVYEDIVIVGVTNDCGLKFSNSTFGPAQGGTVAYTAGSDTLASLRSYYKNIVVKNVSAPMGFIGGHLMLFQPGQPNFHIVENSNVQNVIATINPIPTQTAPLAIAAGIVNGGTVVPNGIPFNSTDNRYVGNTIDRVILQNNTVNGTAQGIWFGPGVSSRCQVIDNKISNCTTTGIRDLSTVPLTNTYSGNYALFNGVGGLGNYSPAGLSTGTPFQNWIFPAFPDPSVFGDLENVNRQ